MFSCVEDGPSDLGPPYGLVGCVMLADEVILADGPVDGQGVLCHVGAHNP
jgi:hypothetical protein